MRKFNFFNYKIIDYEVINWILQFKNNLDFNYYISISSEKI